MGGQLMDNFRTDEELFNSSQNMLSGTLTFLFTDIEGSTHMWEQHPEQMREAMARHDTLLESAVKQQSGRVVRPRGEGDSRFAVFPRATDALRAAIAIQRRFFAEDWQMPPLRVRIALHSGEADLRDGDYYGSTVNRCARLRSVAHGGQILMSQTTYLLVRDDLPAGVSMRDLGEYSLKDLERPEHIFQPVVSDLPSDFPPLNTPGHIRNNLPLALTSFIGRQSEIEELEHLLWQSRLLTIAGPGGAGKTRLSIRLAQNVQSSFVDGVWFIDLAPLSNCGLLSQYVMGVLGMREEAGYSPDQSLLENLRSKTALLILDNCEHLLPEVAQMAEKMLFRAPGLRVIATSREKLGIAGEIIWRIPPLSSPDLNIAIPVEELVQYEAVKLFSDRAAAARPGFGITPENADTVAKICARLDGIPLAIELAAARVRVLSVEDILARLGDRFHLLVGARTALPRQQTLRALIDWSYDLLTEKERLLLRRLSVFAGGWRLEAAEQVCSDKEMESWEVLDLLTSLVDKSFVMGETQKGHERYRFLETILKFSQERLLESHEAEEFACKHAAYFLKLAENSYGKMWGREQAHWLDLLDEESGNLRTALDWSSRAAGEEEMLLRLSGSLWRYWEIRGYLSEGRSRLETALAKNPTTQDYWRANGLGGAGQLARQQGDYLQAKALHEQSLSLFRAREDRLGAARQLNALGEIAQHLGDYNHAVELHGESLTLRREIGDKEGIAVSLRQLGVIARDRGQYQPARELLEESLKLERELGDKLLLAISLNDLGLVAHELCDYEQAVALFEEALSLQRELNDRPGISNSLQNLGNVAKDQGIFQRAQSLYQECLELKKELGDKRGICRVIVTQAEIAFRQGKYPLAADLAGDSLALAQQLGLKREALLSYELLGFISYYQGNYERAAKLAEETLASSIEIEAPRAIGYADVLSALVDYSQGNLVAARGKFQEALAKFHEINDCRNVAGTYVHLARTAYRQGDQEAAMQHLEAGRSISQRRNIRWTYALVLEIMGLLQRSSGNYKQALELLQESLRLAFEQENLQGIANCLGALAGLAVMANQAQRAARLFAAASKLRREMGAQMSNNDRQEYEHYLALVHDHLDHVTFEAEWSQGFSMTTEQIITELNEWSCDF
jgi:predicted ATPase/class 3 adenylate cyclase